MLSGELKNDIACELPEGLRFIRIRRGNTGSVCGQAVGCDFLIGRACNQDGLVS